MYHDQRWVITIPATDFHSKLYKKKTKNTSTHTRWCNMKFIEKFQPKDLYVTNAIRNLAKKQFTSRILF